MPESFSEKLIMQIKMNSIKKYILEFWVVAGKGWFGTLPFIHSGAIPDTVGLSALPTQHNDRAAPAIGRREILVYSSLLPLSFPLSIPSPLKHPNKS